MKPLSKILAERVRRSGPAPTACMAAHSMCAASLLARVLGVLAVLLSVLLAEGIQRAWLWPLAAIELFLLYLVRKRKHRIPAAAYFMASALVPFQRVCHTADSSIFPLIELAFRAGVVAALLWPRQSPKRSGSQRLPGLPVSWALASTLIAWTGLAWIAWFARAEPKFGFAAAAVSVLVMFLGLALASWTSFFRWAVIPAAFGLASAVASNQVPRFTEGHDLRAAALIVGPVAFAAAFDWFRAPRTPWARHLRTAGVVFAASVVLPLAAAPHQVIAPAPMAALFVWSSVFGLASAMTPRLAPDSLSVFRSTEAFAPSLNPWARHMRGLWMPLFVAAGMIIAAFLSKSDGGAFFAISSGIALVFAVPRARGSGLVTAYMLAAIAAVLATEMLRRGFAGGAGVVLFVLSAFLLARWSSTQASRGIRRRLILSFEPHPRVSAALGAAALFAAAAFVHSSASSTPSWRSAVITDMAGPIGIQDIELYRAPRAPDRSDLRGASVGAVAIDPLGRGTWIADEELDQVKLVGPDGKITAFDVGQWPEQVIASRWGTVYVSCRQSGRVYAIDAGHPVRFVEVGAEPRALALDEDAHRLYVGLVTDRQVVALDAFTLEQKRRRALDIEPYAMAETPRGIAVLPDRGSEVIFASRDLDDLRRVPLFVSGRTAWHGRALVPVGRDLVVFHSAIDTGLSSPAPSGGYGGGVQRPVETMITVLRDQNPSIYGLEDRWRALDLVSDVTGAAFADGKIYVASRGTESVLAFQLGHDITALGPKIKGAGLTGLAQGPDGTLATLAAFDRGLLFHKNDERRPIAIGRGRLSSEVAAGRRLFYSAVDLRISNAGFACATCHPDGREDGLVWRLKGTVRQTPFLAGRLTDTAPYNWLGTSPTLVLNVHQTIERLGGRGLGPKEERAIAAYLLDGLRAPVRPEPAAPQVIALGKAIFHDESVGCARCHDGTAYTDGMSYDVSTTSPEELAEMRALDKRAEAESMDVPSLRYVGLSAPYFHNGSAKTLEALIEDNRDRMGHTSDLSAEQKRALIAYLRAL